MTKEEFQREIAFPVGSENEVFKKLTVGTAYLAPLAKGSSEALHMTLEPCTRTNWHTCRDGRGIGQMLICTGGRGLHVEEGKPPVKMHKGSVVQVPPDVECWQGAASDSWFSVLYITAPDKDYSVAWGKPIGDKEYMNAQ